MKIAVSRTNWKNLSWAVAGLIILALSILGAYKFAGALDQGGGTSTSGGCANINGSNPYNFCTNNGFGWTYYKTDGSLGRPDFFKIDSWGVVSSTCAYAGGIYIFEVAGKNGSPNHDGGRYTQAYPMNIIWSGGYYPGHSYWNSYYKGADWNTVRGRYYAALGGATDRWEGDGHSLEWFCYDDNPPWTVTAHSTVNLTVAEPGQKIIWRHYVVNGNQNSADDNIKIYYRNSGDLTGSDTEVGTVVAPLAKNATSTVFQSEFTIPMNDSLFGKTLCRSTVATPNTHKGGTTVSGASCVKVVKKPKINVKGGDVVSKSDIRTSISPVPDRTYGSFGEYGLFANGVINGMGSGGAYGRNGASGLVGFNGNCSLALLTFANSRLNPTQTCSTVSTYGSYGNSATLPNLAASFPILTSTPAFETFGSLSNLINNSSVNLVKANGNLTLSGASLGKGRWLIINASGRNVTITGNITYNPGTMRSLYDIPQLVIIANNININANVTNVDAWLSASGTINTCSNGPANLTVDDCNQLLTVNGPVSTSHLLLRRTAGGGIDHNAIGDPAEIFNLRADAYLWSMARALEGSPISVASTIELPPRF